MLLTHDVMSILLEARELTAQRGQRELFKDISFSVSAGEALHVVGANGSGKTTLIRILAGLVRHGFQGRVDRNSPMFYMGHQSALKGHLTVLENLSLDLSGWSSRPLRPFSLSSFLCAFSTSCGGTTASANEFRL